LIALMIDAHPSAEGFRPPEWRVSDIKGIERNLTSLLHDLTRTGGQAQSHWRRLGPKIPFDRNPGHDRSNHLFTMSDNF